MYRVSVPQKGLSFDQDLNIPRQTGITSTVSVPQKGLSFDQVLHFGGFLLRFIVSVPQKGLSFDQGLLLMSFDCCISVSVPQKGLSFDQARQLKTLLIGSSAIDFGRSDQKPHSSRLYPFKYFARSSLIPCVV